MTDYTNGYFGATTMTEMIARLKKDGSQVVWIEDTPYPGFNIPDCLSAHTTDIQMCSVSLAAGLSLPTFRDSLAQAASRSAAILVDPVPWFCTAQECPPVIANTVVYADQDHVTKTLRARTHARTFCGSRHCYAEPPFGTVTTTSLSSRGQIVTQP